MQELNALIVEDNHGDFLLIKYLFEEEIPDTRISHAENFQQAAELLSSNRFDIIFLDLTLPDCSGNELVSKILKLAGNIPVFVLTGYSDKKYGVESLALGVSDYLLKEELSGQHFKKSVLFGIERAKISSKLKESEEKYKAIFHFSPLPMWVYDTDTFDFLDVNEAAIQHYGFSREEFLIMNFKDLIPENASESIDEILRICNNTNGFLQIVCYHITKDKEIIKVELQSNEIEFEKQKSRLILAHDITQKTRAEEALKLSELRFKALVQKGSDVFSILDQQGKYRYIGANSIAILGIPPGEFKKKRMLDFIHPDDVDIIKEAFLNILLVQSIQIQPYRFLSSTGYIWLETIITNMIDDLSVAGIVANSKDITQQKIEEHRLKLLESVVTNSTDAVILFAIEQHIPQEKIMFFDGEITYVNNAFTKITGIEKNEAIGNSAKLFKTLQISKSNLIYSLKSLRNFQPFSFEFSYFNRWGDEYFLQLSMTPVADSEQKLTHWAAIVSDITERTKKEHEITKAIIGAQELERYEIGCELHDNINQILSATQLALGMTKDTESEDSTYWVSQASSYIDLAIDEIRRLSHRLAPNSLDGTTFHEAVDSLVKSLNVNNRINFTLNVDLEYFSRISSEIQINLYRIIQEQLNNIIKHSRAKNVLIKSTLTDSVLTLKIKDDGIGFNIYTVKRGIGLNNIVKRCDMIHADLSVISDVNKGCEISISLKISDQGNALRSE